MMLLRCNLYVGIRNGSNGPCILQISKENYTLYELNFKRKVHFDRKKNANYVMEPCSSNSLVLKNSPIRLSLSTCRILSLFYLFPLSGLFSPFLVPRNRDLTPSLVSGHRGVIVQIGNSFGLSQMYRLPVIIYNFLILNKILYINNTK